MLKKIKITAAYLLPLVAVAYFGLQWLASSKIAGNIIFSQSRLADRQNFYTMVNNISELARNNCGRHGVNQIFFDDSDVLTPYLISMKNGLGSCVLTRETVVTPFTTAEKQACNIIRVHQFSPPGNENPNEYEPQTHEIALWYSTDHRYGYQVTLNYCVKATE